MKKSYLLGVILCLACSIVFADIGAFYRYKDENGNIVINRTIPNDKVKNGYEVLSDSGRVIQVVERQLTEDELSDLSAKQIKERKAKVIKSQQREYDLQLLRRYSFVGDIESEKNRKVKEMDVRVQILKGNLLGVRNELEVAYEKAAKVEKRGSKVPESTLGRINDLETKLTTTEQLMKKLLSDMESTRKEYLLAIERFKELKLMRQ